MIVSKKFINSTSILLSCLCMFLAQHSKANPIDSLRENLNHASNKTERNKALVTLCESSRMMHIDSFKHYMNELNIACSIQNNEVEFLESAFYKALYFYKTSALDSTLSLCSMYESKLNKHPNLELKFNNLKGVCYIKKTQFETAYSQFYKTLQTAEKQNNILQIINAQNGIGWTSMELDKKTDAIFWFQKAIALGLEQKVTLPLPSIYNNLASCYGAISKFDSATYYCMQAIQLSESQNDLNAQANANFILGNLCLVDKRYSTAETYFLRGYELHKLIGDPFFIVSDMASIAIHYSFVNQYEKGIDMAEKAIEYAKKNNLDSKLSFCYDALSMNYKGKGDYKSYSRILEILNELKDSTYAKTSQKAIAEMNAKYETEKKANIIQKQQFELTKKNYYLSGGILLILLSSFLMIMLYRNYNFKQEKKLQTEIIHQQDLSTRAVLQAEENERQRIGADLHDGMGQLLTAVRMNLEGLSERIQLPNHEDQQIFNKVKLLVDESCKEIRSVSHNIMPNALIKSGLGNAVKDFIEKTQNEKLQIQLSTVGMNEKLNDSVEIVVYRVIQECVQNVIKHARATKLDISMIKDEDGLNVTIEDNGQGFQLATLDTVKGIGVKNIKTRIEFLKGGLDIDSKPNKGTLIAFYIPTEYSSLKKKNT